jgi:hypothetical protein
MIGAGPLSFFSLRIVLECGCETVGYFESRGFSVKCVFRCCSVQDSGISCALLVEKCRLSGSKAWCMNEGNIVMDVVWRE